MTTLVICILAALAVLLPHLPRRAALVPCTACGIAQAGASRTPGGRCATCQQREHLGAHTTQAVRAIRAQADAAAWR